MSSFLQSIQVNKTNKIALLNILLVVFYLVGIIGIYVTTFREQIFGLTPWILISNFVLVILFHQQKIYFRTILVFLTIFVSGIIIEIIGVSTHSVFGQYYYGDNLGVKIMETPVIIGLNWLLLTYLSSSVLEKVQINSFLKVLLGAFVMILYDLVLEQIASYTDMWYWQNDAIPVKNYLVWFLLSLFFHSIIKIVRINTQNKLALTILICQFGFLLATFFLTFK